MRIEKDHLFSGSKDNTIRRWEKDDPEKSIAYRGHLGPIKCFELVDNILYSGSQDHTVRAWHVEVNNATFHCIIL
jgi:WD40 repeat protein